MKYYLIATSILLLFHCGKIKSETVDSRGKIVELCCEPTKLFNLTNSQCEDLPLDFNLDAWEVTYTDTRENKQVTANILKDLSYKVGKLPCKKINFSYGLEEVNFSTTCLTPLYDNTNNVYRISTVFCLDLFLPILSINIVGSLLTPYSIICTQDALRPRKFFKCNFITWLGIHAFVFFGFINENLNNSVSAVWLFLASSRLWLKVTGYELWLNFMNPNREFNFRDLSQKRFTTYSKYIWVMFIVMGFIPIDMLLLRGALWKYCYYVVIPISMVGFAFIAFRAYKINNQLKTLSNVVLYKPKISLTVLWTLYMLDLPWMLFIGLFEYFQNILLIVFFTIFIVFEHKIIHCLFLKPIWQIINARHNN